MPRLAAPRGFFRKVWRGRDVVRPRAIPDLAQNLVPGPKSFGSRNLCSFSVIRLQEPAEQRLA